MKYLEIATGKPVQASKGYMSNYGGVVVQQPDVWVVLGLGGVTLRSEEGFKEDYTLAAEEPEKPKAEPPSGYFSDIGGEMRRDFDLLRAIALERDLSEYTEGEVNYHIKLLRQGGLTEAPVCCGYYRGEPLGQQRDTLTSSGHDFADLARSDEAWQYAKDKVARSGGSAPFEIWRDLLREWASRSERLPTEPNWKIHFDPELRNRGEYVVHEYGGDRDYRIDKDAADALCQFMLREWYTKRT